MSKPGYKFLATVKVSRYNAYIYSTIGNIYMYYI